MLGGFCLKVGRIWAYGCFYLGKWGRHVKWHIELTACSKTIHLYYSNIYLKSQALKILKDFLSQYTLLPPSILIIYRITHNSLSCRGIICPLSCVLGPNYWVKSLIILPWNQDYADIVRDKYKHLRSKILLQFGKLSQLTERNQENCAKKYVYGQYWDFLSKII